MDGGVIEEFLVVWGVGSSMGGIWKEWESVGVKVEKCGGRCEKRCGGRCGEVCWSVGEVRGDVGDMGSSTHFLHLPPHFHHLPHISPFLPPHFSTSPSTLPHSFHIPPILDPTPQTTKNFPITPPSILLQTPPNFLYFLIFPHTPSPRTPHSHFIIYPTPKLLTFLIYWQINSAIKYTRNSL